MEDRTTEIRNCVDSLIEHVCSEIQAKSLDDFLNVSDYGETIDSLANLIRARGMLCADRINFR